MGRRIEASVFLIPMVYFAPTPFPVLLAKLRYVPIYCNWVRNRINTALRDLICTPTLYQHQ
jgi:hypothetical protein